MKTSIFILPALAVALTTACSSSNQAQQPTSKHSLAVVDPGHFHAALVTKSPLAALQDTIRLYAPEGAESEQYLGFIDSYNSRSENPTHWSVEKHISPDFIDGLMDDKTSDIVVLAGNNRNKTDYILAAIQAGKNVLADKPMAIDRKGFEKLAEAYKQAADNGLTIRELMTERYDTLNIFTREFLNSGKIGKPTTDPNVPTVEMTSVHHFFKEVSGKPLQRPTWYYDVEQQGEGIADVTTHLIDLIMWQCFPGESIDWQKDVEILDARHSATVVTPEQYLLSTGDIIKTPIEVYSNGYILARIKDITVKLTVRWDFQAPAGSGDTFSAVYRYTGGQLNIIQDQTTGYRKEISILVEDPEMTAEEKFIAVNIPDEDRTDHETHFNCVTSEFLKALDGTPVPEWEAANTLAKYRLTTDAVEMARQKK